MGIHQVAVVNSDHLSIEVARQWERFAAPAGGTLFKQTRSTLRVEQINDVYS